MPRYFFSLRGSRDLPDEAGTDLANDDAARVEAVRSTGEMLRDFGAQLFWAGDDWTLVVSTEDGRHVTTLRFSRSEDT